MLPAAVLLMTAINAVNATLGPSSFAFSNPPFGYRTSSEQNHWRLYAINQLWLERIRMGHTPLKLFQPPGFPNTDILLKDESRSRTQSVKHRFAWALLLWAISEGKASGLCAYTQLHCEESFLLRSSRLPEKKHTALL